MIVLTEEDIEKINSLTNRYLNVHHLNLSSGSYYVKFCSDEEAFRELIGKKVFDIAGILSPEYYYYREKKSLISSDVNQMNNFMHMCEVPKINKAMFNRQITLDIVINSLKEVVKNKDEIELQINIMHFIDILFSNSDRHLKNYGVSIDSNENGSLIVFDNGEFIDYLDCITKPMSCKVNKMTFIKSRECNNFIEKLSDEHKDYMYQLIKTFTPRTVELLMNQIEKENNHSFKCKKSLLRKYMKNYILIYTIIFKNMNIRLKEKNMILKCK